jgi:hypothetical protein
MADQSFARSGTFRQPRRRLPIAVCVIATFAGTVATVSASESEATIPAGPGETVEDRIATTVPR